MAFISSNNMRVAVIQPRNATEEKLLNVKASRSEIRRL
jgi:hypothetical protein